MLSILNYDVIDPSSHTRGYDVLSNHFDDTIFNTKKRGGITPLRPNSKFLL